LLNFFVAVVMFSIGLRTSGGDLLNIARERALLVRTLLANCVLIPVIGLLLVRIFPLSPDATISIVLLTAIPGTPIALSVELLPDQSVDLVSQSLDGFHRVLWIAATHEQPSGKSRTIRILLKTLC